MRSFPGGATSNTANAVRAIAHTITPSTWTMTLDLVAVPSWLISPALYDTALYDTAVYA